MIKNGRTSKSSTILHSNCNMRNNSVFDDNSIIIRQTNKRQSRPGKKQTIKTTVAKPAKAVHSHTVILFFLTNNSKEHTFNLQAGEGSTLWSIYQALRFGFRGIKPVCALDLFHDQNPALDRPPRAHYEADKQIDGAICRSK